MEQIQLHTTPTVLLELARLLGTQVVQHRLEIPEKFGRGYCTGFVFNTHIRMLILNYELTENLVIENREVNTTARMILFKFQHVLLDGQATVTQKHAKTPASVLIATSSMKTETLIPVHSNAATINIEVDADYLKGLFNLSEKSPVLQSLLQNTQPLLFDEVMYPFLQNIVNEMMAYAPNETFRLFFLRIKAEELICRLLMELEKRDEQQLYALNRHDVLAIYHVRQLILEHLNVPPAISALAVAASMSPTKLKRLFRQIFGNSIFNYYQSFRMKEAARLLNEEKLSVSAVGYQLGFTNLSHFSRVFKEHIGLKPKQYSRA
jgi:AraC-like DNA-binding protein